MASRILVTGASGFVGRALVTELAGAGHAVRAAMRHPADLFPRQVEVVAVSDLTKPVEWRALLKGIETVVHLAGIAHAGPEIAEQAYDRVNRQATAGLADAAARMGVQRLVFASSIRAQSGPVASAVLDETHEPRPTDPYGRSKLAAEQAVRAANVPFTILRPVLVYGPGVKGNLARLAKWARSPWPLPFGAFSNRRSILARQNLIDAIHFSLRTPATAGETYIVADPVPLTLPQIVTALRTACSRSPGLFSVPGAPMAAMIRAIGKADVWDRLAGDLVVDPGKLMRAGWQPPMPTMQGLAAMMQGEQFANQG